MQQVKLSVLLNIDNRLPRYLDKRPPGIHMGTFKRDQVRRLLKANGIVHTDGKNVHKVITELLHVVQHLPAGTLFSVGSLINSATRPLANHLGREFWRYVEVRPEFEFITCNTGKCIYRRTGKNIGECVDPLIIVD